MGDTVLDLSLDNALERACSILRVVAHLSQQVPSGVGKLQRGTRLQCARDRTGERHLEPVEHPGDAEGCHRERVETPPRQAIQPRRNVGFEDRYSVPMC